MREREKVIVIWALCRMQPSQSAQLPLTKMINPSFKNPLFKRLNNSNIHVHFEGILVFVLYVISCDSLVHKTEKMITYK